MSDIVIYLGLNTTGVIQIFILVLMLGISAMASSSEIAFFSLSREDINQMKSTGRANVSCIERLLSNPDKLLASILVINNTVNIIIVILAARIMEGMFQFLHFKFLFEVVIVTFILLFFGEILPKVVTQRYHMYVASIVAYPILCLSWIAYPLTFLLIKSGRITKEIAPKKNDISIEDLADVVDMTTDSTTEERKILSGIVGFASREVEEIMKPRMDIIAVENNMSFLEVKQLIIRYGYSRLPVFNDDMDHIIGILYVKDLTQHLNKDDSFVWQSIVRDAYFAPPHKKLEDLLKDFQREKVHMAVIVDEYGATQGLVTMEDILEEVVGEISDESDHKEAFYRRINENTYIFDGKTHIVDMTRILEIDEGTFSDVQGKAETVAGLLLEIHRNFLHKNEEIKSHNIRFQVLSLDGHRIKQVKIIMPVDEK
ncbi:MAG: gliding motility-associated protein GldE [Alistipes sp.]|nr:gliding motility-associated protein GldE [Candidatus Alistipes equi]